MRIQLLSFFLPLLLLLSGTPAQAAKVGKGAKAKKVGKCKRQDRLLPLRYLNGGAVWIPKEVSCGGLASLIVVLHGNMFDWDPHPNIGGGRNLQDYARAFLDRHLIRPVVLAEPVHKSYCGGHGDLYSGAFDFSIYRQKLMALLKENHVRVRDVSVIGHSGAGCCSDAGVFRAAQIWPQLYLFGTIDTCYNDSYYSIRPRQLFAKKKTILLNVTRGAPVYSGFGDYART